MTTPETARTPWHDRFREPTLDALLACIPPAIAEPWHTAREGLLAIEGLDERLGWEGVPWRWCLRYERRGATGSDLPVAYMVPEPAQPKLCIPLPTPIIASMKPRSIARTVREGILASSPVDGIFWPTWALTSKSGAEELIALARFRLSMEPVGENGLEPAPADPVHEG